MKSTLAHNTQKPQGLRKHANMLQDKLAEKEVTNILCATAAPGLAATNLQATTASNGGGFGMQTLMRFSQSGEDGSLPLLHATVSPEIESGDFIVRSQPALCCFVHVQLVVCADTAETFIKVLAQSRSSSPLSLAYIVLTGSSQNLCICASLCHMIVLALSLPIACT